MARRKRRKSRYRIYRKHFERRQESEGIAYGETLLTRKEFYKRYKSGETVAQIVKSQSQAIERKPDYERYVRLYQSKAGRHVMYAPMYTKEQFYMVYEAQKNSQIEDGKKPGDITRQIASLQEYEYSYGQAKSAKKAVEALYSTLDQETQDLIRDYGLVDFRKMGMPEGVSERLKELYQFYRSERGGNMTQREASRLIAESIFGSE